MPVKGTPECKCGANHWLPIHKPVVGRPTKIICQECSRKAVTRTKNIGALERLWDAMQMIKGDNK